MMTVCFKGLLSADCNVSDCRYVSDFRSRGHEFVPGLVLYFREDLVMNFFLWPFTASLSLIKEEFL